MAWRHAFLICAASQVCGAAVGDTDQYGPANPVPTPAPTLSPTLAPTLAPFAPTPAPYPATTRKVWPDKVGHPHYTHTSPGPWWERKDVRHGLIGGAAAAGIATFGGLGIAAIVQANKATTTPVTLTPTLPPTLPPTYAPVVATTTANTLFRIQNREEEETSSVNPLWLGLFLVCFLCCLCGFIAFCVWKFQSGKKRATRPKKTAPAQRDIEMPHEKAPLVSHHSDVALPPVAPAPMMTQAREAPLFEPHAFPSVQLASPSMMAPTYEYAMPATMMMPPTVEYAMPATMMSQPVEYRMPATMMAQPVEYMMPATTPSYAYGSALPTAYPSMFSGR